MIALVSLALVVLISTAAVIGIPAVWCVRRFRAGAEARQTPRVLTAIMAVVVAVVAEDAA